MNNNLIPYLKIYKYKLLQYIKEYLENSKKNLKDYKYINSLSRENLVKFIEKEIPKKFWKSVTEFEKYDNPKKFGFEKNIGLQKLTKDELLKMDFGNENKFDNPFKGSLSLIPNPKTNQKELIELLEHQRKFLTGYLISNLKSAIAFHGVGTGKTLTAVACSRFYLQLFPKNKVIFISPPSILYNFIKSLAFYGIDPRDTRYIFFTYDKWYRSKTTAENAMLIVDEAHNFRTEIKWTTSFDSNGKEITSVTQNKKGESLLTRGGKLAHKTLLLTATPFVNKTYDIENLLAISEGRDPLDPENFGNLISNTQMRYDYFKYRISHYERSFESSDFPERREVFIPLVVPKADESKIRASTGKNNPFYIFTRQNSTTTDDIKIKYIMDDINNNKNSKFVIYTTFEETGYIPLQQALSKAKVPFSSITGKDSLNKKAKAIEQFNEFYNKSYIHDTVRVIIITRAGAEGVDLKETTTIYVMDGQWNDALYEQIVARAIRYRSHHSLPKKLQYVNVKKLFLCYQNEKDILDKINSNKKIDFISILNSILETRESLKKNSKIMNKKDTNKSNEELFMKFANFGDLDYDPDKLKELKKGSKERREYLEKNKSFSNKKEQYVTSEITSLTKKMPSTDFYMFVLQKVKMNIINAFIKQIDKIPSLEKSVFDLEFGKKMFKLVEAGKIDNIEMMKKLFQFIRSDVSSVLKTIDANQLIIEDKLTKFISQAKTARDLQKNKNFVNILQEYFTPKSEAVKLINLSKIVIEYKRMYDGSTINILEPSAGQGGLIFPLLELILTKKLLLKIDMVEFSQENRRFLESLCEKTPDVLNLEKTNDFLEFFPNKTYHFIFMNPPFHLSKKKTYIHDVYDYDFVKRAYAMLEINGVLVAITGQSYKTNKEIVKWYANKNAIIKDDVVRWSGDNLKKGAEIQNLKLSYIYIRKLNDDQKENNELLKINHHITKAQ